MTGDVARLLRPRIPPRLSQNGQIQQPLGSISHVALAMQVCLGSTVCCVCRHNIIGLILNPHADLGYDKRPYPRPALLPHRKGPTGINIILGGVKEYSTPIGTACCSNLVCAVLYNELANDPWLQAQWRAVPSAIERLASKVSEYYK